MPRSRSSHCLPLFHLIWGRAPVVQFGEIVMILNLHPQGLSVSTIARRTGFDRKTIRKHIEQGLEAAVYDPRPPRLAPYAEYLRERVAALPGVIRPSPPP